MTDTAGAIAAMQEAAGTAPAEPIVEQQAPVVDTPATETAEDFSVMPLWKEKLEQLPESMRADYAALINQSENAANVAIRKAREASVPTDYRTLYEEAKEAGLTADQIRDGYNNALALQEALLEDPYGTLASLESQIDQEVRAGNITLAEGKAAKREIAAAVDDQVNAAPLETEADRKLAELEAWKNQQEQREQSREQQFQQQSWERDANQFIADAEQAFVDAGLVDAAGQHLTSVETRRSVFMLAGQLKDQNPQLGTEQAVTQAVTNLGGWDRFKPVRTPGIPVGGSATAPPAGGAAAGAGDEASRKAEALALIRNMMTPQ